MMAEEIEAAFDKALLHGGHETYPCCSETARALAMAVHDTECLTCLMTLDDPSPEFIATVELRRRGCENRARIEALGR